MDRDRDTAVRPPPFDEVLDGLVEYNGLKLVDIQHTVTVDLDDLVTPLSGRQGAVICRSPADVAALSELDPNTGTFVRVDRIHPGIAVDYALYEAVSEATVGRVAAEDLPVATHRDDRYGHLADEWVLRRAWAVGAEIYLTKELEAALTLRDELGGGSGRAGP